MRKCRKAYERSYWRRIDVICRGMKRVRILKSKAVLREAKKEVGQVKNKTYMMSFTRGCTLRKEERHCIDWRGRDTKRERT